jgi:hypothetical protein
MREPENRIFCADEQKCVEIEKYRIKSGLDLYQTRNGMPAALFVVVAGIPKNYSVQLIWRFLFILLRKFWKNALFFP